MKRNLETRPLPVSRPTSDPNEELPVTPGLPSAPSPREARPATVLAEREPEQPLARQKPGPKKGESKTRFTSMAPDQLLARLHSKSYWGRMSLTDTFEWLMEKLLDDDEANRGLPQELREERGLPPIQPYTPRFRDGKK